MRYCLHTDTIETLLTDSTQRAKLATLPDTVTVYLPSYTLALFQQHENLVQLLDCCDIAKTPSYVDTSDTNHIQQALTTVAAQAVDAKIISKSNYWDDALTLADITAVDAAIRFINLKDQYHDLQPEMELAIDQVLNSSQFIMGEKLREFEQHLCDYTGASHAISCASGTDALMLALLAIDIKPGDEVIMPCFSFFATAEIPALLGAKIVFVDIDPDTYLIDLVQVKEAITSKTKVIMPVSLYGQVPDMAALQTIADQAVQKIYVIEDAAQSFGATQNDKQSCHLSELAATSFFPAKPLGAYGDAGAVFTSNAELAEKMIALRVHGQTSHYRHPFLGINGRCDTLQAAILDVKLQHYDSDVKKRQDAASVYQQALADLPIQLPSVTKGNTHVYAQYTVRAKSRDALREQLTKAHVPTAVHYPIPMHLQPCFDHLGYQSGDFPVAELAAQEVLSLPISAYLSEDEQYRVIAGLRACLG